MSILSDPSQIPDEVPTAPLAGPSDVVSCRSCGGPVAREQRYCLSCGSRRNDQRVPFAETLGRSEEVAPAVKAAKAGGVITPGIAAAIVCGSVLFLGTGVLIGRSNDSGKAAAVATPQVVTVAAGGSADTGASADTSSSSGSGGSAKTTKTIKKTTYVPPPKISAAAQAKLKKSMNCKSEAECQDAMKKIPNDVVTPGAPPPVDNKPPAGGAKGQTFQ